MTDYANVGPRKRACPWASSLLKSTDFRFAKLPQSRLPDTACSGGEVRDAPDLRIEAGLRSGPGGSH